MASGLMSVCFSRSSTPAARQHSSRLSCTRTRTNTSTYTYKDICAHAHRLCRRVGPGTAGGGWFGLFACPAARGGCDRTHTELLLQFVGAPVVVFTDVHLGVARRRCSGRGRGEPGGPASSQLASWLHLAARPAARRLGPGRLPPERRHIQLRRRVVCSRFGLLSGGRGLVQAAVQRVSWTDEYLEVGAQLVGACAHAGQGLDWPRCEDSIWRRVGVGVGVGASAVGEVAGLLAQRVELLGDDLNGSHAPADAQPARAGAEASRL